MAITETAEQIAFRFLKEYHRDDQGLVEGWRRNADRRWNLTLQLCHSFLEEIQTAQAATRDDIERPHPDGRS